LSHASNLRKEIGYLLDQWLDENACAMVARWLIEQRERAAAESADSPPPSNPQVDTHSVSDNVLAD
jgi:hypothetical protein